MEFQEYPKWKYHATKEAVIVDDEAQEKALGKGWHDAPISVDTAEPEKSEG